MMMDVSQKKGWTLAVEFFLLYGCIPLAMYFVRHHVSRSFFIILWFIMLGCLVPLLCDRTFPRCRLGMPRGWLQVLPRVLRRFLAGIVIVTAVTYLLVPQLLFAFPRHRPGLWLLVMVLYPLLSVYPQEIIFRTFYYHRYAPRIPDWRMNLLLNGIVFGWAHLFFANWIAPLLCVAGGVLFADTYRRSQSTLLAALEHSLWGDFIFTVGLGWYFYGGSITATQ